MDKTKEEVIKELATKIEENGGRAYYVGGFVRDKILGIENKDIDIEVHGINIDVLEKILESIGKYKTVGKSFGIYLLCKYDIDIALPRKEKLRGIGHKDFDITVDPYIGTYNAAIRRDFTINALYEDILTGEIIDHFNGKEDLKNGIIRHVNAESFIEDPLRVLRAAQFASRFKFRVDDETIELCKTIDITTLSKERVFEELKKALLKSENPSIFFEVLKNMDQLKYWFKELNDLIGIPQPIKYHPEGDAYNHTLKALDNGVKYLDNVSNPMYFLFSCLTHDFGKIVSTIVIDEKVSSKGHDESGLPLIDEFINRISQERELLKYTKNMCINHMKCHTYFKDNSKISSTNRLFYNSINPLDLIYLAVSDIMIDSLREDELIFLMERLEIFNEIISKPYVTGKTLKSKKIKSGPIFKELLDYALSLRFEGKDFDEQLLLTLKYYDSIKNK